MPEKIVFVGFKDVMTKKRVNNLEKFFSMKRLNIKREYIYVERYNYSSIVEKFSKIIEENDDCCFDLTGGKELILTAMGEVSSKKNIPMIQFNVRTGKAVRVRNCDDIATDGKALMSIKECVALNGGSVVCDDNSWDSWHLDDEFKKDIERIWNICNKNNALWNKQSKILGKVENECLFVEIDMNNKDVCIDMDFINELKGYGLISECGIKNNILQFRYKNKQIKKCILKSGNILELYVYMIAREINKERCYSDIDIGVVVDWDGVVYNYKKKFIAETRNEIDVMIMKGVIPVFISCKNGSVHKEALYELSTVAERFGGKYSKKILITTSNEEQDPNA